MSTGRLGKLMGALSCVVCLAAPEARGSEAPPARTAEPLVFVNVPPPAPRPPGPAPLGEADEYARRPWEAFPMVALDAPFCQGDPLGSSRCADAAPGSSFGGGAVYRLTPYVAIGASAAFTSFRAEGASLASSRARWFGLVVRGYFLERGAIDPYVEAGFGAGTVDARDNGGGRDVRTHASGPATTAAVGIDFWVLPNLRVGPALSYRWTWLTHVERCADGACSVDDVSNSGAVGSHLSLGLLATFALGREM